jgi:hypothetical protein
MRPRPLLLAALLAGCAGPPPISGPRQASELVGRAAGTPQRCVLIRPGVSLRVADGDRHTLIYDSGRTVWANHLGAGCGFGRDDILVTEPTGSYHCRGDLVRSIDSFSKIRGPSCILGDFVPYSR